MKLNSCAPSGLVSTCKYIKEGITDFSCLIPATIEQPAAILRHHDDGHMRLYFTGPFLPQIQLLLAPHKCPLSKARLTFTKLAVWDKPGGCESINRDKGPVLNWASRPR